MAKNLSGDRLAVSGAVGSSIEAPAFRLPLTAHGSVPTGDPFAQMRTMGHEQLLLSHDPSCGYFGIVAIHDTTLEIGRAHV